MAKTIGKYVVRLSQEEREYLLSVSSKGRSSAKKIIHARILLRADASEGGENCNDEEIASLENVCTKTVGRVRQRFVEEGLESALNSRPPRRKKPRKLDGEDEAKLIAICCSRAPEGRARWTLRLLANQLVEMEVVDSIAPETVRQTLKKTNLSLG